MEALSRPFLKLEQETWSLEMGRSQSPPKSCEWMKPRRTWSSPCEEAGGEKSWCP